MNNKKKTIFVVVLHQGEIATDLANCLSVMKDNPYYNVVIEYSDEKPISHNRNTIVQKFLGKEDYDYLMMIDSDIVPNPSVIQLADYQKDIVGALCFMYRENQVHPVVFERKSEDLYTPVSLEDKDGLEKVDAIGTGCIMLSRKVLQDIKSPFSNIYDPDGIKLYGLDIAFCRKAQEKGYEIYCNFDYPCSHWVRLNLKTIYAIQYNLLDNIKELKNEIEALKKQIEPNKVVRSNKSKNPKKGFRFYEEDEI